MIVVSAVQEKERQREICGLCGIGYDPDCMAYAALDSVTGELLGCAQFTLAAGGVGVLESVGTAELSAEAVKEYTKEGIRLVTGRAAMNFMDLAGFHTGRVSPELEKDERLMKILGFEKDENGVRICDLGRLFTGERHK